MAVLNFVMGNVMSGKSTSIINLNPDTTFVVVGVNREVPLSADGRAFKQTYVETPDALLKMIEKIDKTDAIKTLVLDDIHFVFAREYTDQAKVKGFDKYTDYFVSYAKFFDRLPKMRDNLFIHILWHVTPIVSGNKIIGYEPKFIGNATNKYNPPLGLASLVLFAKPMFNDDGYRDYKFLTKSYQDENGIEYPARTKDRNMFPDLIDNDLEYVEKTYREFSENGKKNK